MNDLPGTTGAVKPDTNDAVACGRDNTCDTQSRHAIVETDHRAGALNAACSCRTLDADVLRRLLEADPQLAGLMDSLQRSRPNLFSSTAVFLSGEMSELMQAGVLAIERIIRLPAYQTLTLARAPPIAQLDFGPLGAFMSYDFHLGPEGPRLIEINTNAGGALLTSALTSAQVACCEAMNWAFAPKQDSHSREQVFLDMFLREWHLSRGGGTPGSILVVDDVPGSQYLAAEFELFRRLFERNGIKSDVVDPTALQWRDEALWHQDSRVGMIYNRLTDFYLAAPEHSILRNAYESSAVVLTPHPRSHALHADKRNLITLSDQSLLSQWGVPVADRELLHRIVPQTRLVTADNAEELWSERRRLFFKPAGGYGAKATYRGDKLTRRVWGEILSGTYVAQTLAPPTERLIEVDDVPTSLKFDLRAYTYDGEVLLVAARMFAGQTTNFRTPGGGFAAVIVVP
jgi:hypothetical protein